MGEVEAGLAWRAKQRDRTRFVRNRLSPQSRTEDLFSRISRTINATNLQADICRGLGVARRRVSNTLASGVQPHYLVNEPLRLSELSTPTHVYCEGPAKYAIEYLSTKETTHERLCRAHQQGPSVSIGVGVEEGSPAFARIW